MVLLLAKKFKLLITFPLFILVLVPIAIHSKEPEKLSQKAEATMHMSGGNVFADAVHEDMYAAIDGLIDKLDRQVKKHKEKLTNHHRGNSGLKNQEPEVT